MEIAVRKLKPIQFRVAPEDI